ncbi:MAG: hypothetical protein KAS32_03490, partial [Candidatus Peribacteraceae bacterium]|nr:hypothetical protein [Candidatus Peribacteraceae bacterium]
MNDLDDLIFSRPRIHKEDKMTEPKKRKKVVKKAKDIHGTGLDIGTGWIVGAKQVSKTVKTTPLRDCFYSIDQEMFSKSMFNKGTVKYVDHGGMIHIVGEDALTLAKIQN